MTDNGKEYRRILGHYPTGVCAVTAMKDNGVPAGLIVGSFTTVSLNPMLVAFFPDRSSTSWPEIKATGRFCVNVLADCQQDVCKELSAKGDNKFKNVGYHLSKLGSPILDGALAWIDCTLDEVHEAGDHFIVLGKVHDLNLHQQGDPMIFHKGGYSRVLPI